jgi:hypothetical protein
MMKPRQSDNELPSKSHTISMLFTQLAMPAPSQKIEIATQALEQLDGSSDGFWSSEIVGGAVSVPSPCF